MTETDDSLIDDFLTVMYNLDRLHALADAMLLTSSNNSEEECA